MSPLGFFASSQVCAVRVRFRLHDLPASFGPAVASDAARHARYAAALARQKDLYSKLVP